MGIELLNNWEGFLDGWKQFTVFHISFDFPDEHGNEYGIYIEILNFGIGLHRGGRE